MSELRQRAIHWIERALIAEQRVAALEGLLERCEGELVGPFADVTLMEDIAALLAPERTTKP